MTKHKAKPVTSEFASKFSLYGPLVKALEKKGYKTATPIQRKVIPELILKKDVVGMARTGSGKTGAFVVPLLHHLKAHSGKVSFKNIRIFISYFYARLVRVRSFWHLVGSLRCKSRLTSTN